jgi:hypothetical protein|tara:strand:+ start:935 stop:1036 length:102 start_codon:yes stop_codon:yes gene_type:complete
MHAPALNRNASCGLHKAFAGDLFTDEAIRNRHN